jgi:two-component system, OmpR family, response regulator
MSGQPILVCTDDQHLLAELPDQLRLDGYRPHTAQAPRQFRWALREHRPAAVVLGELPTLAATLTLLRELRAGDTGGQDGADPDVPVLVLSRTGGELCELRAFEAGADDYQTASTSYLVLRARLRALVARSQITRRGQRVAVGPLRIDAGALEASYAGRPLALSRLEFALLHQFAREPRRVFTKDELLGQVWGYPTDAGVSTRTLDAHAVRLRRKLAAAGAQGAIQNRRGIGYRLGLADHDPRPAA